MRGRQLPYGWVKDWQHAETRCKEKTPEGSGYIVNMVLKRAG
jgi:hypothetical protein